MQRGLGALAEEELVCSLTLSFPFPSCPWTGACSCRQPETAGGIAGSASAAAGRDDTVCEARRWLRWHGGLIRSLGCHWSVSERADAGARVAGEEPTMATRVSGGGWRTASRHAMVDHRSTASCGALAKRRSCSARLRKEGSMWMPCRCRLSTVRRWCGAFALDENTTRRTNVPRRSSLHKTAGHAKCKLRMQRMHVQRAVVVSNWLLVTAPATTR